MFQRLFSFKYIFIFCCLSTGITVKAQQPQPTSFEKKLQDFRYSFFAVFEQKNSSGHLRDQVFNRIKSFVKENEAEIDTYRKQHLEKYRENDFSFAAYKVDSTSELPRDFALGMKGDPDSEYTDGEMNTLLEYALVTPDVLMSGIISNDYIVRMRKKEMTIREIAMRVAIASPKERILKLGENSYQIIFDYYTVVYCAEYFANENSLKNIKVWERKQQNNLTMQ